MTICLSVVRSVVQWPLTTNSNRRFSNPPSPIHTLQFPNHIHIVSITMSGWMSYFTGRKDTRESARDAIVGLRQQLLMLEKKEEFLQKKIEEEMKKAKANATGNKRCELCLINLSDIARFEDSASRSERNMDKENARRKRLIVIWKTSVE